MYQSDLQELFVKNAYYIIIQKSRFNLLFQNNKFYDKLSVSQTSNEFCTYCKSI